MKDIITFSERHTHYAIGFIDIVGSSVFVAKLSGREVDFLYATFLNTCAHVIQDHGGEVVKNVGDGLLYYFPHTDFGAGTDFLAVLDTAHALFAAREDINRVLEKESLPPLSFRISGSYGPVSVAEGEHTEVEDIFGFTVNTCAKINRYAKPNTMVIGSALYEKVKMLPEYRYEKCADHHVTEDIVVSLYTVYEV